jgi:hypothetical protein
MFGSIAADFLMDFVPQDRVPVASHEATDFAELLRLIRAGHAGATRQLHRILTPGVSFLLRRRLGRNDVAREAQCVMEAAIHAIQTDVSVRPDGVPRTVRRLIQEQCTGHNKPATETGASEGPPATLPAGILDGMSPVEREALRRCYVLGEAPASFLESLRLTPQEFRAIRARARAEFSSRKAKSNVA